MSTRKRLTPKPADLRALRDATVPGALEGAVFDTARAVSLVAPDERDVTLVPPRGVFDQLRKDLGAAMSDPRPWLVLRVSGPGRPSGQSLVLEPTTRKGELKATLYRRSGRRVAEGTVRRDGSRGVRFVLELLCARGRRKGKAEIRGSLSKGGRWRVELVKRLA
jgi:hypothetical protein